MQITEAGASHNCRFNNAHRIAKGQRRLTILADGDKHHYCLACARGFLVKDIGRLQSLLAEMDRR